MVYLKPGPSGQPTRCQGSSTTVMRLVDRRTTASSVRSISPREADTDAPRARAHESAAVLSGGVKRPEIRRSRAAVRFPHPARRRGQGLAGRRTEQRLAMLGSLTHRWPRASSSASSWKPVPRSSPSAFSMSDRTFSSSSSLSILSTQPRMSAPVFLRWLILCCLLPCDASAMHRRPRASRRARLISLPANRHVCSPQDAHKGTYRSADGSACFEPIRSRERRVAT